MSDYTEKDAHDAFEWLRTAGSNEREEFLAGVAMLIITTLHAKLKKHEGLLVAAQHERNAAQARAAELAEALRGVVHVADRKTIEFDRARKILEKAYDMR